MENFYRFAFDESSNSRRFYKDLTDDDIRYLEAATRHEYDTCNALIDKYFRLRMPNTVVKHQVFRRDSKMDIWEYQIKRRAKHDAGWLGEGIYFYGDDAEAFKAVEYGHWINPFFINVENPFTMDRDLHDAIIHRNDAKVSERMTKFVERHKMDGVLWTGDGREEWCVLSPSQVKRATITRDNEGRIIPISLRFDLTKNDNRF